MRKGTTPTLAFVLPFDTTTVSTVRIIFSRNDETVLVKDTASCSISGDTLTLPLTQEETFLFDCDTNYQVQIRVKFANGTAMASEIMYLPVQKCLDQEVI